MTNIEKLVALYRKMSRIEKDYDGQSFDYAVGMKLGAMAKDGEEVLAAVTGDALENADGSFGMQLVIAPNEGKNYFIIFPNAETASDMGTGYTMCSLSQLLELANDTPQMEGLQLILSVDRATGRFGSGEINANMVRIAASYSKEKK
ncbi:MAG: hypothetical protein J6U16_07625 [Ruminococcus sp.]|nr:hypothetical protein [Ruminococcus sp.]